MFNAIRHSQRRLRNRLSIGVVALVLASTFLIATVALQMVRQTVRASIANEQFARLTAIGDAIDQKFASRRTLLKSFGESVKASQSTGGESVQSFLRQNTALGQAFASTFIIDRSGMIAASLLFPERIGVVSLKTRPYFVDTVARRSGVISQPFHNQFNGAPQVVMTEPVLDSGGEVQYVIVGTINLQERNFLGELANVRFGKTGYMFILNTNGVMIDHPQRCRVLNPSNPPGGSKVASERALAGFEGTSEAVGRDGVAALYAHKRLSQTNWIVAARYPSDEAFEPIRQIERTALLGALCVALLSGSIALAVMRHQLAPLGVLHDHMSASQAASAYLPMQAPFGQDEIGDLARTLDALMAQRQASADQLHAKGRFLKDLADNIPVLIAYLDDQQRYQFVNSTFVLWTGADPATVIGRQMEEVIGPVRYAERRSQLTTAYSGQRVDFEIMIEAPDCPRYVQTSYVPDLQPDGTVAGIYCLASDVTAQKAVQSRLDEIARFDSLTRLANRREFEERLETAMARSRRSKRMMALIYLDIDHFKQINDKHGHGTGDDVLKEFAFRLQEAIRVTDTAARLGGDEFVVILENLNQADEAAAVACKLLDSIRRPMRLKNETLEVTSSMGFALFEGEDGSVDSLIGEADAALYRAKLAGRNTFSSTLS